MSDQFEEALFASSVKWLASVHETSIAFTNQIALTLLRDGVPEPDIWGELEKSLVNFNRRKQCQN